MELSAMDRRTVLFVNGTLMRGFALHSNLAGAEFLETTATAPVYRLHSIDDIHPGMFEVVTGGLSIEGELYLVPEETMRRVEAGEPPRLYLGDVKLADGRTVRGMLFPHELTGGLHEDISDFGGWRAFMDASARRGPEKNQGDRPVPRAERPI